ncbi:hypothetical protein [Arcanobacterium canis]
MVVAVAVGVVWYRGGISQFLVVEKKTEVSEQTQLGVDANAKYSTAKLNGKSFDLVGPSAVKDIQRVLGKTQEKCAQTISRAKELSGVGDLNEENLGDYVAKVTPLVTADTAKGQRISEEESKNFVDLLEAISLIRGLTMRRGLTDSSVTSLVVARAPLLRNRLMNSVLRVHHRPRISLLLKRCGMLSVGEASTLAFY